MVKETPIEDHGLRVSIEILRLRHGGIYIRSSHSRRFENGHFHVLDPLSIGNFGAALGKLTQTNVVISAEQESWNYQGDEEIQRNRQPKLTEKQRKFYLSKLEKRCAKLVPRILRHASETDEDLAQLDEMLKILVDIHEEFEQIDKEYMNNIWFDDID